MIIKDKEKEAIMKNRKDQGCPSALELFEYTNSHLPENLAVALRTHIDSCVNCAKTMGNLKAYMKQSGSSVEEIEHAYTVPEHLSKFAKQLTTKAFDKVKYVKPKELAFGQIWTTKAVEQSEPALQAITPRIVVILSGAATFDTSSETVIVAPISLELQFQSQYDLRIYEDESHLGYEFMIEVWNQTTTVVSQLNSYLGPLNEALGENLRLLNKVYLGLGGEIESVVDRIGLPIFGKNDPRAVFQVQEVEECAYLHEPALREIARVEKPTNTTFRDCFDIWFKQEDKSLYWGGLVKAEPLPLAAATNQAKKDYFLYAEKSLGTDKFVVRFNLDIFTQKLELKIEEIPRSLAFTELLVTGYGAARGKLFSSVVKVNKGESSVVSENAHVMPRDIEELNIIIHHVK
jgi:hypothetical protein